MTQNEHSPSGMRGEIAHRLDSTAMFPHMTKSQRLSRRAFLLASSALPFAAHAASQTVTPKRILVLGGTGFIGPHIIEAAIRRGFSVTLFHRGKTNPTLFADNPKVERIIGDRNTGFDGLAGKKWDAVVDTSGYFPRQIEASAKALKDSVKQYVFVSSISVYKDTDKPIDESSAVGTIPDPTIEKISEGAYGPLKALCEQAATRVMQGRALIVRPGYIVGPRDSSDRFTYWLLRTQRGGEMVVPGDPSDPIQVIDGRDLADWIVRMVEAGQNGTFNATGPSKPHTMQEVLAACKQVTKADVRYTFIPTDYLRKNKLSEEFPIWSPPSGDSAYFHKVSNAKAVAAGLTFRPLIDTLTDTLSWWKTLPPERQAKPRAGLTADKEAAILKAFRESLAKP
jgi:2'-hydroxyisoflavone reductase